MEQFYSTIGIEIECHLVDLNNQPKSITKAANLKNDIVKYLENHNLPTFSLEPHTDLIEFKTNPHQCKASLFNEIDLIYDIKQLANKHGHNILFQGVNPHATIEKQTPGRKRFQFSDILSCSGIHINCNIREKHLSELFQILDLMQQWSMPFSILMQSSPFFCKKNTYCHSSRHTLLSGIMGLHFDFFPKSLMSWEKIAAFESILKQSNKNYVYHNFSNPVQHYIRPKKIDNHHIIEIRFLDTSDAESLKTTIELMAQLLEIIANKAKSIPLIYKDDLLLKTTMHQISQVGRHALINIDYDNVLTIEAWSEQYLTKLDQTLHQRFMHALSKPTLSERLLKQYESANLVT
ncbi:MAG: glutamate-cysteine ligase family protein [Pseudomonadota bacterium]|nr:glutamate-cysteine ligase family protein [Pseudomonadota bacterium]